MEDKRRKRISRFADFSSLRGMVALSGKTTIFPFYHTVSDRPLPHIRHLYDCKDRQQFEQDMEFLLKYYAPVSIEDYLSQKAGRKRRMVLSFDDGLAECHSYIAPYLRKKGVPAIFFLNNDFIDNRDLFHRYQASLLTELVQRDSHARLKAAEFLVIPESQVVEAIRMIRFRQKPLLDSLCLDLEFDPARYVRDQPIFMDTEQIRDLVDWGFHLGAHSANHREFFEMEPRRIPSEVSRSMTDLKRRFRVTPACFAFPFTSDGVPENLVDELLREGTVDVVFGTAGLKNTGMDRFIQRIPMEKLYLPAGRLLRTEYLYYLLKALVGQNNYYKGR